MKNLLKLGLMTGVVIFMAACQDSGTTKTTSKEAAPKETSQMVGGATIIQADNSGWRSHGRTYDESRFSPLDTVNVESVSDLGLAWSYDLSSTRGIEVTPIVHDGIMYVTSTWNIVSALDARTGKELWVYEPEIDKAQAGYACCDAVNRGVAIWGDKVFTATIDGRLVALNAKTGDVVWDKLTIDKTKPYTMTGAPRVVDGKVIIGNGGAELGVRGYVSAYDVDDGEMIWRFYTVPGNPENGFENDTMSMAAETWEGEWWKAGGGGTVWDSMAYDPDLDLLYIGVGNGSPWNHRIRSEGEGDNLFLSSIVALRPDTGEYVWHYQTTPGETWDYTATQHMILADMDINGAPRKVIMQAPKNGFFYVVDRATGEFISAEAFVPVNWASGIDQDTGRPIEMPGARYKDAPHLQLPGPLGAHNWQPMSFSHDTGLVYIPAQEAPWVYTDMADFEVKEGIWNTGTDFTYAVLPEDEPTFKQLKAMLKGRLLAWDPVTQKQAWTVEHKTAWNGGVLSTGGNLVFQGTADAHFAAYNASTGEQLWKYFTQTGVAAAPITYELDGEQYVVVASGWGGSYVLGFGGVLPSGSDFNSGRILTFKLGADGKLPEPPEMPDTERPEPPEMPDISDEALARGKQIYSNSCSVCHGDQAFASGLTPNLRWSNTTRDAARWKTVVHDGELRDNGMPRFSGVYTAEELEGVRAYVIGQARSDRDEEFYNRMSGGQ